jgi:hypothetical protein
LTNFRFPLASFPVRESASHKSQLVTEILYGQRFQIIETKETWKRIKILSDGYEGWIEFNHNFLADAEIAHIAQRRSNFKIEGLYIEIYAGAELSSLELKLLSEPNSRINITNLAKTFLNVPYLWGGKTTRGIDCSGFIQVLFSTQQIFLPRDAYQQAEIGDDVYYQDKEEGDLAFFNNAEGRITHVGLILKNNQIIHASEMVRIDILTETGIWNDELEKQTHQLHSIKRILQN